MPQEPVADNSPRLPVPALLGADPPSPAIGKLQLKVKSNAHDRPAHRQILDDVLIILLESYVTVSQLDVAPSEPIMDVGLWMKATPIENCIQRARKVISHKCDSMMLFQLDNLEILEYWISHEIRIRDDISTIRG
jgi:hypothetical protein